VVPRPRISPQQSTRLHRIYFQYFCGEEFFCHTLPFDRSSMTRWRQRMGEERVQALLQESLQVAVKTGAMKPSDTRRAIIDTTVQPKNVMFPTDAKLLNRAREKLDASTVSW
jgi:IS5 family transposase